MAPLAAAAHARATEAVARKLLRDTYPRCQRIAALLATRARQGGSSGASGEYASLIGL
jgi:hypothetical protein